MAARVCLAATRNVQRSVRVSPSGWAHQSFGVRLPTPEPVVHDSPGSRFVHGRNRSSLRRLSILASARAIVSWTRSSASDGLALLKDIAKIFSDSRCAQISSDEASRVPTTELCASLPVV